MKFRDFYSCFDTVENDTRSHSVNLVVIHRISNGEFFVQCYEPAPELAFGWNTYKTTPEVGEDQDTPSRVEWIIGCTGNLLVTFIVRIWTFAPYGGTNTRF